MMRSIGLQKMRIACTVCVFVAASLVAPVTEGLYRTQNGLLTDTLDASIDTSYVFTGGLSSERFGHSIAYQALPKKNLIVGAPYASAAEPSNPTWDTSVERRGRVYTFPSLVKSGSNFVEPPSMCTYRSHFGASVAVGTGVDQTGFVASAPTCTSGPRSIPVYAPSSPSETAASEIQWGTACSAVTGQVFTKSISTSGGTYFIAATIPRYRKNIQIQLNADSGVDFDLYLDDADCVRSNGANCINAGTTTFTTSSRYRVVGFYQASISSGFYSENGLPYNLDGAGISFSYGAAGGDSYNPLTSPRLCAGCGATPYRDYTNGDPCCGTTGETPSPCDYDTMTYRGISIQYSGRYCPLGAADSQGSCPASLSANCNSLRQMTPTGRSKDIEWIKISGTTDHVLQLYPYAFTKGSIKGAYSFESPCQSSENGRTFAFNTISSRVAVDLQATSSYPAYSFDASGQTVAVDARGTIFIGSSNRPAGIARGYVETFSSTLQYAGTVELDTTGRDGFQLSTASITPNNIRYGEAMTTGKFFTNYDVVIGSPRATRAASYSATATYNKNAFSGLVEIRSTTSTGSLTLAKWKAYGEQSGSSFGAALAVADFDGDGKNDLIVGAPTFIAMNVPDVGRVYVYLAPVNANGATNAVYSLYIKGSARGGRFGFAIANAGKTRGTKSSYEDIVVSAPFAVKPNRAANEADHGAVYLYEGRSSPVSSNYAVPTQTIYGDVSGGLLGFSLGSGATVASASGIMDIMAGQPGFNNGAGRVVTLFGALEADLSIAVAPSSGATKFPIISPFSHDVAILNTGATDVAVVVTVTVDRNWWPIGLSFPTWTGFNACTGSVPTFQCASSTNIVAGVPKVVSLSVPTQSDTTIPPTFASVSISVSIALANPKLNVDRNLANNAASVTTPVVSQATLDVRFSNSNQMNPYLVSDPSATTIPFGQSLLELYPVQITNTNPMGTAFGIRAMIRLPLGMSYAQSSNLTFPALFFNAGTYKRTALDATIAGSSILTISLDALQPNTGFVVSGIRFNVDRVLAKNGDFSNIPFTVDALQSALTTAAPSLTLSSPRVASDNVPASLAATLTNVSATAVAGQVVTFVSSITNSGQGSATAITVSLTYETRLQFISVSGLYLACTAAVVVDATRMKTTCTRSLTLDPLASGSAQFTFKVDEAALAATGATASTAVSLAGTYRDINGDRTFTATTPNQKVQAQVDLRLSSIVLRATGAVVPGATVVARITVANMGPSTLAANGVRVTLVYPKDALTPTNASWSSTVTGASFVIPQQFPARTGLVLDFPFTISAGLDWARTSLAFTASAAPTNGAVVTAAGMLNLMDTTIAVDFRQNIGFAVSSYTLERHVNQIVVSRLRLRNSGPNPTYADATRTCTVKVTLSTTKGSASVDADSFKTCTAVNANSVYNCPVPVIPVGESYVLALGYSFNAPTNGTFVGEVSCTYLPDGGSSDVDPSAEDNSVRYDVSVIEYGTIFVAIAPITPASIIRTTFPVLMRVHNTAAGDGLPAAKGITVTVGYPSDLCDFNEVGTNAVTDNPPSVTIALKSAGTITITVPSLDAAPSEDSSLQVRLLFVIHSDVRPQQDVSISATVDSVTTNTNPTKVFLKTMKTVDGIVSSSISVRLDPPETVRANNVPMRLSDGSFASRTAQLGNITATFTLRNLDYSFPAAVAANMTVLLSFGLKGYMPYLSVDDYMQSLSQRANATLTAEYNSYAADTDKFNTMAAAQFASFFNRSNVKVVAPAGVTCTRVTQLQFRCGIPALGVDSTVVYVVVMDAITYPRVAGVRVTLNATVSVTDGAIYSLSVRPPSRTQITAGIDIRSAILYDARAGQSVSAECMCKLSKCSLSSDPVPGGGGRASSSGGSPMAAIGGAIGGCVVLSALGMVAYYYRARITAALQSRGKWNFKGDRGSYTDNSSHVALAEIASNLDTKDALYSRDGRATKTLSIISNHSVYDEDHVDDNYSHVDESSFIDEIPRDRIKLGKKLGSGNFGDVWQGILYPEGIVTAVKSLKEGATLEQNKLFIEEAQLMAELQHKNIVRTIGIIKRGAPILLVLEFMSNGSLLSYLENKTEDDLSRKTLMGMCRDVAAGMVVLQRRGLVHRDLAARNVLVDGDGTCKIADFGLARHLESDYYFSSSKQQIPLKWTSPEAVHFKKFSSASDVWAFGILCWEVFALGEKPYGRMSNAEAVAMVDRGERLSKPAMANDRIYATMMSCWAAEPRERPAFIKLFSEFQGMFLGQSRTSQLPSESEGYVQLDPTEAYASYVSPTN